MVGIKIKGGGKISVGNNQRRQALIDKLDRRIICSGEIVGQYYRPVKRHAAFSAPSA
jgi:hypothetical protein